MCVQVYIHTHKHISMYIHKYLNTFNFTEWNSLAFLLLEIWKAPLFFFISHFWSPNFPFCAFSSTTHLLTSSPLLVPSFVPHISHSQLFHRQLALYFFIAREEGQKSGNEEIYLANSCVPAGELALDCKYKAKM